jgi:hypothetical protein
VVRRQKEILKKLVERRQEQIRQVHFLTSALASLLSGPG